METSPVFDEIRARGRAEGRTEGRAEGVRATIYRQGRQKFGKVPNKAQQKALESVAEVQRLEALAERLLHVHSWAELLQDE